jgi:hypothetical protein
MMIFWIALAVVVGWSITRLVGLLRLYGRLRTPL